MSCLELEHAAGLSCLTFRHLQLPPKAVANLEAAGVITVGDLSSPSGAVPAVLEPHIATILARLSLVRKHTNGSNTDWVKFWSEPAVELHWMAMTFGAGQIPHYIYEMPLIALGGDLGALINIPLRQGLTTFGDIIKAFAGGSVPWPGFGALKIRRMGEILAQIADGTRLISTKPSSVEGADPTAVAIQKLPPNVLDWDVEALGLGAGGLKLKRVGRTKVRSVLDEPHTLWKLPGIGRSTVAELLDRLAILSGAIADGQLDYRKLATIQNVPILPEGFMEDSPDLSDALAQVVQSVALGDKSRIAPLIFEFRIRRSGSDAATLEDIARMAPGGPTRERVRQIEKRILERAASLLFMPYPILGMPIVHPALKEKLVKLASALAHHDEISPADLGLLIADEWNVSVQIAMRALPLVMALIESTARTTAELKRLASSPGEFFQSLACSAKHWPAKNTGGDRGFSRKLDEFGIVNLEDMRLEWVAGRDFGKQEAHVKRVLAVACGPRVGDDLFGERLADQTSSLLIPKQPGEWSEYLATLPRDIARVISRGAFWADAETIFSARTAALPNERPTSAALGDRLGRHPVTIKKTETETLERLAAAIIHGTGGLTQCIFRADWLAMWQDMAKIFRRYPGDPRTMRRSIEQSYGVPEEIMTDAFPTVWAILSGLPAWETHGRANVEPVTPQVVAPVKLAGFRSIH